MPLVPYYKPWLSQADQIKMLKGRGLLIGDANAAAHFLGHLNYYRSSHVFIAALITRDS